LSDVNRLFDLHMVDYLQPRARGNWRLEYFEFTDEIIMREKMRDAMRGLNELAGQGPGMVVCLKYMDATEMSDTMMEKKTNFEFTRRARGDVLIAGLGLGMIVLAIQDDPTITSITVIEKSIDVIELVTPQLPLNDKVTIIHDNIFAWKPKRGIRYDTIYFDIWPAICGDYYEEMKDLKRKFGFRRRTKYSWMGCWREADMRDAARDWRW